MCKPSSNRRVIGTLTALLAILAAGGYSVCTDRPGVSFPAAETFEVRHQCLENQDKSPFIYPGTNLIMYEGEYRIYNLPGPLLPGPKLPDDLAANPFIKPINFEPVCAVAKGQFYVADGQGCLYDMEGRLQYEGCWRSGYPSGPGVDYFSDGRVRYDGEHVCGLKQGPGRLFARESDGAYYLLYEGDFAYECFHGNGTMYGPHGDELFNGCWYYGEPVF